MQTPMTNGLLFLLFFLDKKGPDPYLSLTDRDPGGPKAYRSYGYGSTALLLIHVDGRIRIHTNNYGSGWPKNLRDRILCTAYR